MENRERILKSALSQFCRVGYRATTIKDISLRARVSQGNIYTYFKSKKDIFKFLFITNTPNEPFKSVETTLIKSNSSLQFIDLLIELLMGIINNNKTFFKLVLIDITEFNGRFTKEYLLTIEKDLSKRGELQKLIFLVNDFTVKDYFSFFTWLLFSLGYSDLVFRKAGREGIGGSRELEILKFSLKNGIGRSL